MYGVHGNVRKELYCDYHQLDAFGVQWPLDVK